MGQMQPTAFFCSLSFIWTQPHPFIYILSTAACLLQEQSWTVAIKSTRHAKLKIFTIYLHAENVYRPLGSRIKWLKKGTILFFGVKKRRHFCKDLCQERRMVWNSCSLKILLEMPFRYNFPFCHLPSRINVWEPA